VILISAPNKLTVSKIQKCGKNYQYLALQSEVMSLSPSGSQITLKYLPNLGFLQTKIQNTNKPFLGLRGRGAEPHSLEIWIYGFPPLIELSTLSSCILHLVSCIRTIYTITPIPLSEELPVLTFSYCPTRRTPPAATFLT